MYNIFTERKIWVAVITTELESKLEISKELFNSKYGAIRYVNEWNDRYNKVGSFAVVDFDVVDKKTFIHSQDDLDIIDIKR